MSIGYEFERSLGFWIGSTARAIEQSLNARLAPHGITIRQVQVLACLAYRQELSQTEIAEMIGLEASTLVRILDRMERDGWVTRTPAPDDRRKKIISVTAKVKPLWKTIVKEGKSVERDATRGLSERQLTQLQKTLGSMLQNLGVQP
jgi:MarR family transcriptional regulator for hemolysin